MDDKEPILPKCSPAGQMAIFWRILHLTTVAWGNYPAGQLLVALTMAFLHNRGMNPTLTDICRATGLPKATVSRYVSWQLQQGLAEEAIDPTDRRRRVLLRTKAGQHAWDWQIKRMNKLFQDVVDSSGQEVADTDSFDAREILNLMKLRTSETQADKPR